MGLGFRFRAWDCTELGSFVKVNCSSHVLPENRNGLLASSGGALGTSSTYSLTISKVLG